MQPTTPQLITFDTSRPRFPDVNHWHPAHDWAAVAGNPGGAGCVGVKISEAGSVSPGVSEQVAGAEAAGLLVVGYHYGTRGLDAFLRGFEPREGRLACVDFEGDAQLAPLLEALALVRDAWGRWPWFYGRSRWLDLGAPPDTEVSQCPYWGPQYSSVGLRVPPGVGPCVAWQYTDGRYAPQTTRGTSWPGIGGCDVSQLQCTPDELRASAGAVPVECGAPS